MADEIEKEIKKLDYVIAAVVLLGVLELMAIFLTTGSINNKVTETGTGLNNQLSGLPQTINTILSNANNAIRQEGNSSANQINMATANFSIQTAKIPTEISAGLTGINDNISLSKTNLSTQIKEDTNQSSLIDNLTSIKALLNSTNNTLNRTLSELKTIGSLNPVFKIWTASANYSANTVLNGTMLQGFDNHISYSTNITTRLVIISYPQYANLVENKTYTALEVFNGNDTNVWYNGSESCSRYLYIIYNITGSAFSIKPNITAKYDPSTALGCG
jgi:hypothetical protein